MAHGNKEVCRYGADMLDMFMQILSRYVGYAHTKQIYVGYVAPLLTFVPANLLIQDKIWIFNILYYSYSGLVTPGLTDTALSVDYALLETPISYPLNS